MCFMVAKSFCIQLIFLVFIWLVFLCRNYWRSLDHDLIASILEKDISILAGNLNSGRSYLITVLHSSLLAKCIASDHM